MEKLKLGTRVNSLGINRTVCAAGCKSRAILLDRDPRFKYIGWDEKRKKRVEIDQDMVIKYGFRPMTTFYYLIARLNTDMKGNVVGDDFVIEYLQLSENLNNDFSDLVNENPEFNSLVLTLVKKNGGEGKDFSYIDVKTSNYQVSQTILDKLEVLRENEDMIESMWKMIDTTTSMSASDYENLLLQESGENIEAVNSASERVKQVASQATRQALPRAQQRPTPQPAVEVMENDDFGIGDDFGETFDM